MNAISRQNLLRRGFALEYTTLGWNMVGIVVLGIAAISARSVALAGFGLDSLIEIGASTVVIWELSGTGEARQRRGLRLIGVGFALLAGYLLAQSTLVLVSGFHSHHSPLGIAWTAVTAAVMFALAAGKARTGAALDNPVLKTEGRVTLIDGCLPPPSWSVWSSTALSAGGGPTRPLATSWSTTPLARFGRSSSATTDLPLRPRRTDDVQQQPEAAVPGTPAEPVAQRVPPSCPARTSASALTTKTSQGSRPGPWIHTLSWTA